MSRFRYIVPALLAAGVQAGEFTLEMKPFAVTLKLGATVIPERSVPIRLQPTVWKDFSIKNIADHGSNMKKGDLLVEFDPRGIEEKLMDLKLSVSRKTLELEQSASALLVLERTLPEKLSRLENEAGTAAEELAYFTEVRRASELEDAEQDLKRSRQMLASYREELKQLLQMYEADDITEDTEEIILQKQRDAVEHAEYSLRMEMLDRKRTIYVKLPREALSLTAKRDDTALALDSARADLPLEIALKKDGIAALENAVERDKQSMADLEKDRALFTITSPEAGMFYHGSLEDSKWLTGDLVKALVPGGTAPVGKTFGTIIPEGVGLEIAALPDQATAGAMESGAAGTAILDGYPSVHIPVRIDRLSLIPAPDGSHPARFMADWPEGLQPFPGQKLTIHLIAYSQDTALVVPVKAVAFAPGGWAVEVKLADGTTERRTVVPGRSSGDLMEILSGVEAGQVVIVPGGGSVQKVATGD